MKIGVLLLGISGLLVMSGIYGVVTTTRSSYQTEGQVIDITQDSVDSENGPSGTIYDATYEFTLPSGEVVTGSANYDGTIGDKVTVFYNPIDPHENRLAEDSQTGIRGSLAGLAVMLLAAWVVASIGLSKLTEGLTLALRHHH